MKNMYRFLRFIVMVVFTAAAILTPITARMQSPAMTPAPEGTFIPQGAVIASPLSSAANLTNTADDYNMPQAVYFNGVGVQVIALEETSGDYPIGLEDPRQLWARVIIGQNSGYGGVVGLIPVAALSFNASAQTFPIVSAELTGENMIDIRQDNGLSDNVIGQAAKGTKARLLGWLKNWAHIQTGGMTGFVRHDQVKLIEADQATLKSVLPDEFDEIQPGYQARYEEYMGELTAMYERYGDSNLWPLSIRAQASELALKRGFLFTPEIHVMPGETDLKEVEAKTKAIVLANQLYDLSEDSWADVSLSFYYLPETPDKLFWQANLWGKPGVPDTVIWMSREGALINHLIGDTYILKENESPDPNAAQADVMGTLDYYLYGIKAEPEVEGMSIRQAEDRAWEIMNESDLGKDRIDYRFQTEFSRNDENTRSWWLVNIIRTVTDEVEVWFQVALVMPDGEPAYHTDSTVYMDELLWAEKMIQYDELIAQRGPFHSWTLEQKAEWDPEYFGLPDEGHLSQDKALEIAREAVKRQYSLSDEALNVYKTAFYFSILLEDAWQVNFFNNDPAEGDGMEGYSVILNAKTGDVLEVFDLLYGD
jgi:hypothetical protein